MKSGSIRTVSIAGIPFTAAADADVSKSPKTLNEAVRHSGGNSQKVTKLTGEITGLTLIADTAQVVTLEALADGIVDIPLSVTYADGSTFTAPGWINLAEHTSMENRIDVSLFPRSGEWARFGL